MALRLAPLAAFEMTTAHRCAAVKLGGTAKLFAPMAESFFLSQIQRRQDVKRIPLIIFGAGKVGRALVGQLTAAAQHHAERDGLSFLSRRVV